MSWLPRAFTSPVSRDMMSRFIKISIGVWALLTVTMAVVIFGVGNFFDPDVSIFDYMTLAPRYWAMGMAMTMTYSLLRFYVSQGVTRRQYCIAVMSAGILACGCFAVLMAADIYGEWLLYQRIGWSYHVDWTHLYSSGAQFGLASLEYLLVYVAHFLAGWLIGMVFYERPWSWRHLLVMLLSYVPAVAIEAILGSGWPGDIVKENGGVGLPWIYAALVAIAIIGITAAVSMRIMRDIAIRPKLGW